jgi:hypothetical protein
MQAAPRPASLKKIISDPIATPQVSNAPVAAGGWQIGWKPSHEGNAVSTTTTTTTTTGGRAKPASSPVVQAATNTLATLWLR